MGDPQGQGPNLSFQARERRRAARNWLHLDLYTANQKAEVERLLSLGARRHPWTYRPGADFVVLEDPDGNLFCVVEKAGDGVAWLNSWRDGCRSVPWRCAVYAAL